MKIAEIRHTRVVLEGIGLVGLLELLLGSRGFDLGGTVSINEGRISAGAMGRKHTPKVS